MYVLMSAILVLWFYSVYTFAKWRFHNASQKGVVLVTILHDRLTNIFLRVTAGLVLALILYIIY
jgi:hypothetical protein